MYGESNNRNVPQGAPDGERFSLGEQLGVGCQFDTHVAFYGGMEKSAVDDFIHVHRTGGAVVVAGVSVAWTTRDIRASDSSDGNLRLRGVCDT